jgi:hypothetical protein
MQYHRSPPEADSVRFCGPPRYRVSAAFGAVLCKAAPIPQLPYLIKKFMNRIGEIMRSLTDITC